MTSDTMLKMMLRLELIKLNVRLNGSSAKKVWLLENVLALLLIFILFFVSCK